MLLLCFTFFLLIYRESTKVISMNILNSSSIRLVTSVEFSKEPSSSTLTCMHGCFSFFNVVRENLIILTGGHIYSVGNIQIIIFFSHTTVITKLKPRMKVILYKSKPMWRSSPGRILLVSIDVPSGKMVVYFYKTYCTW